MGVPSVDLLVDRVTAATDRVVTSASAFSDAQAREPSALPGWSRGHVLTHLARNADGLRNLLIWAETGIRTPMYPSREARDADIEAGSGRPAAELSDDIARSAAAFTVQARRVPDEAWSTEVRGLRGPSHAAWVTLLRRMFEVEVHHVDLAADYRPTDWPGWFVAEQLDRICAELAEPDAQRLPAVLSDLTTGRRYDLRPGVGSKVVITGRGHELLAWLLGRGTGRALTTDPAGPLPVVPPYG